MSKECQVVTGTSSLEDENTTVKNIVRMMTTMLMIKIMMMILMMTVVMVMTLTE